REQTLASVRHALVQQEAYEGGVITPRRVEPAAAARRLAARLVRGCIECLAAPIVQPNEALGIGRRVEARVEHPERPCDPLRKEAPERQAGKGLDDSPEHVRADAVRETLARVVHQKRRLEILDTPFRLD